jgi:hypothetical protein
MKFNRLITNYIRLVSKLPKDLINSVLGIKFIDY